MGFLSCSMGRSVIDDVRRPSYICRSYLVINTGNVTIHRPFTAADGAGACTQGLKMGVR